MDFKGPEPADLVDVRSLNVAFLDFLRGPAGEPLRQQMPASLRPVVAALTERQTQRLADVPFLIISLSESDESCWNRLFTDTPVRDLFAAKQTDTGPLQRIGLATLGFLWQLARRNPYATRLVSGGPINWCEQLASCTLLDVLERATLNSDLIVPRLADDTVFWYRLLGAGLSSENEVRRAAHLSALQTMLTPAGLKSGRRFRSAACYSAVPAIELKGQLKDL